MTLSPAAMQRIRQQRAGMPPPAPAQQRGRVGPPLVRRDPAGRMRVQATNNSRAGYNALTATFGDQVILTPSTLRSEVLLTTQSSLTFEITATANAAATERRLSTNDAFVMSHVGVFIGRRATANARSTMQLHSFDNPLVFTDATEILGLAAFYNGDLNVQVNDVVYMDGLDMYNFRRVDGAQAGLAVSTVVTAGVTGRSAWEQNRAFKDLTPWIIFNGLSRNVVTCSFSESFTATAAAGSENYAVLLCRGYLAQNGAKARF